MTATTNGASLEDCLTNIFSLIDLNGIRWKRFKHKENNTNYLYTPNYTHPILTTYAKCIEENHIAVWRHEPQKRHSSSSTTTGHVAGNTSSTGHSSNFPTPTRTSNNNTPTSGGPSNITTSNSGNQQQNNSNTSTGQQQDNYELWIFGYGNQLRVDNVIGEDLVEIEDDNWESKGLSYECRTLLFKALHNLVERCLISKGFTKIGRWFVQPTPDNLSNSPSNQNNLIFNKSPKHIKLEQNSITSPSPSTQRGNINISSTISSTIERIIESRREVFNSQQCLDKSDGLRHTSIRSSSSYFTTSLDGSKSSLSFAFSFFVHGDINVCTTVDVRQHPLVHPLTKSDLNTFQEGGIVRIALAPFGLNGILNGVNCKDSDNGAATTTFIQQWSKFYPLPKTMARLMSGNRSSNSAITTNFNPKTPLSTSNQYNQASDGQSTQSSRSYLSNLTNMLLPPSQKPPLIFNLDPNELPPVVEVIVAGYRMRYPSECVFTTSKVIDLYKSLSVPLNLRSTPSHTNKRPNKSSPCKQSKLSLLIEKSSDDGLDTKVSSDTDKSKTNFTSPFELSISSTDNKNIPRTDGTPESIIKSSMNDGRKDKTANGCSDSDIGMTNTNLPSNTQASITRYNSTKVGFIPNNAPLGPTDLVKLFPTPPSLEQIDPSPSTLAEEAGAKETITMSLANQTSDSQKDNGIDVYKPVEYAAMPPPPKWAALTNIVISSSKSLPPHCIYNGSSQNTVFKNVIGRMGESNKGITTKNMVVKQFSSLLGNRLGSTQLASSPLTDQTNKNGFNNLSLDSTLKTIGAGLFNSNAGNIGLNQSLSDTTSAETIFSSITLPHQRLFNNLNEVNAIQLNLMISDSALGMLKDHNFESCTLCVCNMSVKGTPSDSLPQKIESFNQWRQPVSSELSIPSNSGEFTTECTCGFSAMTNRHCSHLSGLFLEDELELTNVLYDPTEILDQNKIFRKLRLSNYSSGAHSDEQRTIARLVAELKSRGSEDSSKWSSSKQDNPMKEEKSSQTNLTAFEETKLFVIDQLKQQCSSTIHSNSSLSKVLLIESFRNNRQLTSCSNYYAQTSNKIGGINPLHQFLDDTNKYTTVKMLNRNPISLRFSDFCELTKGIITRLDTHSQTGSRLNGSLMRPLGSGSSGLSSIFSRICGSSRQPSLISKPDSQMNNRNNLFIQGLQALVIPTLAIDPKGALQLLEHLVKEDSKEDVATLNRAILIFTSPIHDWQFLTAPVPENNFDVANLLKLLQPALDESIGSHNKLYKDFVHQQQQHIFSARDSPTGAPIVPTPPCQGPLTWRQFHQAAGRGAEDQCEPQPIPSLLVTHHVEKNHLALSPFALKFWDKLLLEPYAPGHNLYYLVIAPDNPNIMVHINTFFKELSNTYELMKLGKHSPIGSGVIMANLNSDKQTVDENWFSNMSNSEMDLSSGIFSKLKSYAVKLDSKLAKSIIDFMEERQPPYDAHADRFDSSPSAQAPKTSNPTSSRVNAHVNMNRTLNNLLSSNTNINQHADNLGASSENATLSDSGSQAKSQTLISSSSHGNAEDNNHLEDEASKQSGIVIYMIDPFSSPSINHNLRTLSTIGLMKCYSMLLDNMPDHIKRITQLQLISLDSIVSHSRPIFNTSRVDQLKSLSMNIYSRCRKILTNQLTAKSLTGFGPAAALDAFFKTKNPDLCASKMFTPPFILAPMKDKQTELGEMFGDRRERSSVLFCSYCITEDQRWLLASVTNDRGDLAETTVININVVDRMKKPKTSVKRVALRKLMEFIVSVMSDWMNPWRLIIGKLGRVGHGELNEWASLMSKRSLLSYSRHLTERCRQCSILPSTETVSILSSCLVSLEPDSRLRIMPDQFTSDDRQASFNKCPLSTPEDASATHILVFPTSASIQPSHNNVEDPLAGSGLDDDLLNQFPDVDGIDDLGVEENMDDLFSAWDDNAPTVPDHINPHHDTMSSSNLQLGSCSVGDNANNQDETYQLLQQPLALGYYISTAKIGQMPNWFWSTSPHLRNSCPVFLKSALHIHIPCVQLPDDLLHSGAGQRKSHQLDSNLTTDVLRYVLDGYNSLSWLALNPKTYDRQSCLPVHMQNLLQLYHLMESFS